MATISDIRDKTDFLCDSDTTSYPAADFLINVNEVYEKVVGMLIARSGDWEFDDTNYTDYPRGKATMVAGQKDYSFGASYLAIERVQVKDDSGDWHFLSPIDKRDYSVPLDEYYEEDGLPEKYDKDGKSLLLYPGPASGSVTLTDGLRVDFRRTADVFTSAEVTTGTKEPGFASPWHMVLAYGAAIPYCQKFKKDRVALYEKKYDEMMREILDFYSRREKDTRNIITTKPIRFR